MTGNDIFSPFLLTYRELREMPFTGQKMTLKRFYYRNNRHIEMKCESRNSDWVLIGMHTGNAYYHGSFERLPRNDVYSLLAREYGEPIVMASANGRKITLSS